MSEQNLVRPSLNSLLCLELSSLILGYRCLELITLNPSIRILESRPITSELFLIICETPTREGHEILRNLRQTLGPTETEGIVDHAFIENFHSRLISTWFNLSEPQRGPGFLFLQTQSISAVFETSQKLIEEFDLDLAELKVIRGSAPVGHAVFRGPGSACSLAAEMARTRLRSQMRSGDVLSVESPSSLFSDFVGLSNVKT